MRNFEILPCAFRPHLWIIWSKKEIGTMKKDGSFYVFSEILHFKTYIEAETYFHNWLKKTATDEQLSEYIAGRMLA